MTMAVAMVGGARRRAIAVAAATAAWSLSGCGEPGSEAVSPCDAPAAEVVLVEAAGWAPAPRGDDPWRAHAPPGVSCAPGGVVVEEGVLEVDTALCAFASLGQPLRAALEPCDEVRVALYNDVLFADPPAEAHLGVALGGEAAWETQVAVPGPSRLWSAQWRVGRAVPAGSPVVLHLHNHGLNTWRVLGLVRVERGEGETR